MGQGTCPGRTSLWGVSLNPVPQPVHPSPSLLSGTLWPFDTFRACGWISDAMSPPEWLRDGGHCCQQGSSVRATLAQVSGVGPSTEPSMGRDSVSAGSMRGLGRGVLHAMDVWFESGETGAGHFSRSDLAMTPVPLG